MRFLGCLTDVANGSLVGAYNVDAWGLEVNNKYDKKQRPQVRFDENAPCPEESDETDDRQRPREEREESQRDSAKVRDLEAAITALQGPAAVL